MRTAIWLQPECLKKIQCGFAFLLAYLCQTSGFGLEITTESRHHSHSWEIPLSYFLKAC